MSITSHSDGDVGIINKDLLIKLILEQCPNNIIKNLVIHDGIRLDTITTLRLDFMKIIKIEHIWMLKSLTTLSIAHNEIRKIENLEKLVNLKHLDLSFNKISNAENLDTLQNIEILMLNNNKIENLESMNNLNKIIVLSVSSNIIRDCRQIIHLRKFQTLSSLSIQGNPVCKEFDNDFVKAVLPQILYLNYIMISENEKKEATDKYKNLVQQLKECDRLRAITEESQKIYNEQQDLNYKSFVDRLDGLELFEEMFKSEKEILELITNNDLKREYKRYEEGYLKIMEEFIPHGYQQYYIREDEIESFQVVIREARDKCMEKCRMKIEKFVEKKNASVIIDVQSNEDTDLLNFQNNKERLYKELMTDEFVLHESSMETIQKLENNLQELSQNMIEHTKTLFENWREIDQQWIQTEQMFFENVFNGQIELELPHLENITSDRETLQHILQSSYDNHQQYINNCEDTLLKRIEKHIQNTVNEIRGYEINRNRSNILKIINVIKNFDLSLFK